MKTAATRIAAVCGNDKPEAVDPDDLEMLEDLVQSAVNAALTKAQEVADREMGKLTGGFNIPGMFGG